MVTGSGYAFLEPRRPSWGPFGVTVADEKSPFSDDRASDTIGPLISLTERQVLLKYPLRVAMKRALIDTLGVEPIIANVAGSNSPLAEGKPMSTQSTKQPSTDPNQPFARDKAVHRLLGVANQIERDLNYLMLIGNNCRQGLCPPES